MMTKIIHNIIIDKQTKLSKKAQNAGDVESNMSPQVAGREVLCVMRVIKRVTYPQRQNNQDFRAKRDQQNGKGARKGTSKDKGNGKGGRRANRVDESGGQESL